MILSQEKFKALHTELAAAKSELETYRNANKDFAKRVFEAEAENERLRRALELISDRCNDRHAVMMLGVQGFSTIDQIAKTALKED